MIVEFPATQCIIGHTIWDAVQHIVYRQKIKNIDHLKQVLDCETWSVVAPSVAAGRDFDSSVFLLVTDCFVAIWSLKLCVEISFDSVR